VSSAIGDRSIPELDGLDEVRFDHVAIAAPRLRDILPLWVDGVGGQFLYGADNHAVGWRLARLAFAGQPFVELMEPLRGSTFFDKFFARNPNGGMHHVTFIVADLPAANKRLIKAGYEPFGFRDNDPHWQELFVHPGKAHGVLLQVGSRDFEHSPTPAHTPEEVLAGNGFRGDGVPSP
jgi:methylmalonyl-CoA/ethylmalonyl-CoA epimerase